MEGEGDKAGVCVCLYECMYACMHSHGRGVFSDLQNIPRNTKDTLLSNNYVPLHQAHGHCVHTLKNTPLPSHVHHNQQPAPRVHLQTPSLVVSSHSNLKDSFTSPSR